MFKGMHFLLAALAAIATVTDFWVEALPRPQQDDSNFTFVDGFAFEGGADRMIPIRPPSSTRRPAMVPTRRPDVVTTTAATVPSASPERTRCTQNCRVTSEYNPVCGTDQIVYGNPGLLACAKSCGVDVEHAHFGPCTSNIRG